MEYSNGTAEAYRYPAAYDPAFAGQQNNFCGNGPPPSDGFHLSAAAPVVGRRFHPYIASEHVASPHTTELTSSFTSYHGTHQCDQCGAVYDSAHGLAEHIQTHHFGIFPDAYPTAHGTLKTEPGGSETAEILDLDSHKVHVYQPPGMANSVGTLAPTPPYTPATSVGSASNSSSMGWMTPTPPLPSLAPPQHEYRPNNVNVFPNYEIISPVSNGAAMKAAPQPVGGWKPSNPPGSGAGGGGGAGPGGGGGGPTSGNHGGGSEARRPKTYNCEACNKWFTSSGHLKRHYNTTLHKNAVKANNPNGTAGDTGRRSTTPSNRSTPGAAASPLGSDETKLDDRPNAQPSPKPIPSPSNNSNEYRPQQQLGMPTNSIMATPAYPIHPPQPYHMQPTVPPLPQPAPPPPPPSTGMDQYRLPFNVVPANPLMNSPATHGTYYCPPGTRPSYPPLYPPMQHGYPQNSMGYPPNPVAPPPSSNTQPGVGQLASRGMTLHPPQQQQQQQQHHHLQQHHFNNNNNLDQRKEEEEDGLKIESEFSSPSEGSPDGSEDLEADASDAELETKRMKNAGLNTATKRGDALGSFKCTQCDKAFNRVCYLTQHNNTFHKGDKPFKCHMCGKRFQNAELFSQHQQKHAGDKPYKCPLCPKQFNHKTDLRRHMCLHTGQKPFMCQVCNKGFIRKDHMVKHVQTHTRRNAMHANAAPTATSL